MLGRPDIGRSALGAVGFRRSTIRGPAIPRRNDRRRDSADGGALVHASKSRRSTVCIRRSTPGLAEEPLVAARRSVENVPVRGPNEHPRSPPGSRSRVGRDLLAVDHVRWTGIAGV